MTFGKNGRNVLVLVIVARGFVTKTIFFGKCVQCVTQIEFDRFGVLSRVRVCTQNSSTSFKCENME